MKKGTIVRAILLAGLVLTTIWWFAFANKKLPEANAQVTHGVEIGNKHGGKGAAGNRPVPVLVASIKKGDIRVVQTAVGTVVSSAVVTVRSRVNGQLVRVLFKEGQLVRAGDLLAEIDPRPFQAQLAQVQGQALRDQALLHNSQIDLERYKILQAQDSIASQQVDAQASLVQQYQGTVQADQGVVDNAKLQLSFTRITAPISGRIGLRQVDVGNNITTTDGLAVINTINPIHVVFTLAEDQVSRLVKRLHDSRTSLPVEAWDRGNTTILAKGNLLSLDNQIDTTSGTIKLKAQFPNGDNLLFPNQFVNARLLSDTLRDTVIAPNTAIQHGSSGAFVYLVSKDQRENKTVPEQPTLKEAIPAQDVKNPNQQKDRPAIRVKVRPVKLGVVDGDNVAVLEGLNPGDQVVVNGIDKLRDGAKIIISSPEGKTEGGKHHHGDNPGAEAAKNSDEHPRNRKAPDQAEGVSENRAKANKADPDHPHPDGVWKKHGLGQKQPSNS